VKRFFGEPIQPEFKDGFLLQKKAGCPFAFQWRGARHLVTEIVREWHDYSRKGDSAHTMREAHAKTALRRGSRGVGRDYYHVRTLAGREFLLYYDRAPRNLDHSSGSWIVRDEIYADEDSPAGSRTASAEE
jgi:hypothetical protein